MGAASHRPHARSLRPNATKATGPNPVPTSCISSHYTTNYTLHLSHLLISLALSEISCVEIVMLEKLDCHISKRATRPIYMRVQVRLNAISPYQSQQSSPAIQDISAPAIQDISAPALRDSSPAETCICNIVDPPSRVVSYLLAPPFHHTAKAPSAFVVLSMAEPFLGILQWVPARTLVEPGSQRLHPCHRNTSLGPRLAPESVTEVFAALVGRPLCLGC
jgi:hypothetical protein